MEKAGDGKEGRSGSQEKKLDPQQESDKRPPSKTKSPHAESNKRSSPASVNSNDKHSSGGQSNKEKSPEAVSAGQQNKKTASKVGTSKLPQNSSQPADTETVAKQSSSSSSSVKVNESTASSTSSSSSSSQSSSTSKAIENGGVMLDSGVIQSNSSSVSRPQDEEEGDFDHLEKAAEDLVANLALEVG